MTSCLKEETTWSFTNTPRIVRRPRADREVPERQREFRRRVRHAQRMRCSGGRDRRQARPKPSTSTHCVVPNAAKIISHPLEAPALLWSDVGTRLAHMDKSGVDVGGAQHQPVLVPRRARSGRGADPDQQRDARPVLRRQLDRLVGFATAALQFPDLAAQQVEHAVKTMGFRGAAGGSCAGRTSRTRNSTRSGRTARRRRLHAPARHGGKLEPSGRLAGNGLLTNTIGNPLGSTIALSHFIFEGTLDRFPASRSAPRMAPGSSPATRIAPTRYQGLPNRVGTPPKLKPDRIPAQRPDPRRHDHVHRRGGKHLINEMGSRTS